MEKHSLGQEQHERSQDILCLKERKLGAQRGRVKTAQKATRGAPLGQRRSHCSHTKKMTAVD